MLMNNVVNEASNGVNAVITRREDGAMRRKTTWLDLTFTWITRAIFVWLVLWGFLVYLRYEWMMW